MPEKTKKCGRCNRVKELKEFFDESLKTKYGRHCMECKEGPDKPTFPKKICPECGHLIQLHFDIKKPEGRSKMKYVHCSECHAPAFDVKY